jgi:uncharacterized protein (DUF1800 family)
MPAYAGFANDRTLKALLRAILLRPEFQSATARTGLIKTPTEWIVGLHRSLGTLPNVDTAHAVQTLQHALFRPPSVAGWPANSYWVTTASVYDRMRTAVTMAEAGDTALVDQAPQDERPMRAAELLGIESWSARTTAALSQVAAEPKTLVALAACSPEYVVN